MSDTPLADAEINALEAKLTGNDPIEMPREVVELIASWRGATAPEIVSKATPFHRAERTVRNMFGLVIIIVMTTFSGGVLVYLLAGSFGVQTRQAVALLVCVGLALGGFTGWVAFRLAVSGWAPNAPDKPPPAS